jgi:sucrose synthase
MIPSHTGNLLQKDIVRQVDLIAQEYIPTLKKFFIGLRGSNGKAFLLSDQITDGLERFLGAEPHLSPEETRAIRRLFRGCQEIIVLGEYTYALLRPKIAVKRVVRLHPQADKLEEVSRNHYLQVKDAYVEGHRIAAQSGLILDFSPYYFNYPRIKEPGDMGEGISYLNRHLSGQMYQNAPVFQRALLRFLQQCQVDTGNLFVNEYLNDHELLADKVDEARSLLSSQDDEESFGEVAHELRTLGLEAGWGSNVSDIRHNLGQLSRLIESPDPSRFEQFLSRLPIAQRVVMISPHGWFAQEGVLGRPDTGGQVTYVLDQARAIERELIRSFERNGIDTKPKVIILTRLIPNADGTSCNVPKEKVHGTEDCWILRVPFRNPDGSVIRDWISRFRIWPYLERFSEEARNIIVTELLGEPDLIIGHYTDGNLVAYLLADRLDTTHCAAVHALEKTKYLFSDINWAELEKDYHFSLHFTADMIAYNSADYIISSTYREIGGSDTEMGLFESYETFTMPGLYRVVSGMDAQLARYNIVPPGANEDYFFPNHERQRRVDAVAAHLEGKLFSKQPAPECIGHLRNPDLPPIFTMARVDRVKNVSGLVEMFGKSSELRDSANLIIISSLIDPSRSNDLEEIEQIKRIYRLVDQYRLDGHFRWYGASLPKVESGETYRVMADRKGVFAQPALMETFGLTVIEAMACGLPVVVTCYGGPAEIVISGKCGEVENPNRFEHFAACIAKVITDSNVWNRYAQNGIQRVNEAFSWPVHAKNILRLANVYAYWNYLNVMNREALDQYVHTLYHTVFRPRAEAMAAER